jgi:hypothetical protein
LNGTKITGDNTITDPYAGRFLPTLGTGYSHNSAATYPANALQTVSIDAAHTYTPPMDHGTNNLTANATTQWMFGSSTACQSGCIINGSIGVSNSNYSGTLNLSAGVYFITGGVYLGAGANVTTSGATIILSNSSASSIGTFNMSGNPTLNMSPPSKNDTVGRNFSYNGNTGVAGIALMQDPRASRASISTNGQGNWCTGNCNTFSGTTSSTITGAFYFPMGGVKWSGSNTTQACFQFIADSINLQGSPGLGVSGCGEDEETFGPTTVRLAE